MMKTRAGLQGWICMNNQPRSNLLYSTWGFNGKSRVTTYRRVTEIPFLYIIDL